MTKIKVEDIEKIRLGRADGVTLLDLVVAFDSVFELTCQIKRQFPDFDWESYDEFRERIRENKSGEKVTLVVTG